MNVNPVAALAAVFCAAVSLQAGTEPGQDPAAALPARCIALPLPSVRGATGSAADVADGVRDLTASFLAGPSLRTVLLDARLAPQAIEEAKQKNCGSVLTIVLSQKKSGGGTFGKVMGDAAGAAAWHLPYGGTVASTATRSAAMAGSAAVSSMAANTRAKDELEIEYHLLSDDKARSRDGKDRAKANSDGEDLLTPLVERMATAIFTTMK